jgi:D-arabinose 5-phosphate isomerase GutQ
MELHHQEHLEAALETLNKILKNQTKATHHIANQFSHSKFSKAQITKSLNIMNSCLLKNGKVVICGIGKSYKIGAKMVATMNSLSIQSALLHPSEALHGDLGILRKENHDCIVMISSSGKSPELLQLLPHIAPEIPIVLLTNTKQSILSSHPQVKSLLFADLPSDLSEQNIYGLNAPTISTTLCLTLADAVSIALAELYVSDINERKRIFGERHPGGAIGEAYRSSTQLSSYFNTPNYSASSLSSGGAPGLSPISSTSMNIESEEGVTSSKVVFDLGFDDAIDEEMQSTIECSDRVIHLQELGNEFEILQYTVLYDFVVLQGAFAISSARLKEMVRAVYEQDYDEKERLIELQWRVKASLARVKQG